MSFVRRNIQHHAYLVGKDSIRKGSFVRVGVIPFVPARIRNPNSMPQEKLAPISSLERKK